MGKLVFVLLFDHVVFLAQSVIQYAVPDIPENVDLHVQRNRYLEKFLLYKVTFETVEKVVKS